MTTPFQFAAAAVAKTRKSPAMRPTNGPILMASCAKNANN